MKARAALANLRAARHRVRAVRAITGRVAEQPAAPTERHRQATDRLPTPQTGAHSY